METIYDKDQRRNRAPPVGHGRERGGQRMILWNGAEGGFEKCRHFFSVAT
jgi:hypothetical protein